MLEPEESTFEEEPAPEESGNNRTFIFAMGGMALLVLLSLACIAGYVFLVAPRMNEQRASVEATTRASNATVEAGLTGTAVVLAYTPTSLPTASPTETLVPSPTPVVVQETNTPDATATIAAALTDAAKAQLTIIPTSTALAPTGIADDIGLPGLAVMAVAFVVVILLARRMRAAPSAR
ncbi:MAG: hypothetical protein AB1846_14900 [Chloroflexota bacterium]